MRTKQNSKRIRTLRRQRLALALVTAMAAPMAMAQSSCVECLPYYGQVVSGGASSNYDTTGPILRPTSDASTPTMTITQTTPGAIIDWNSFNIGSGYEVTFVVPNADGVTLNRVVGFMGPGYGVSPSMIGGTLSSNGNVFIINPAGITFAGGSQVNVGSLVASTLDIDNGDFLAGMGSGRYTFQPPTTGADVNGVTNAGNITTAAGGTVAFVGSTLANSGSITTPSGSVVFGSGSQVTLDFFGDGLTQVTVNGPGVVNQPEPGPVLGFPVAGNATNSGTISADGGQILMRVASVAGYTEPAIWNTGTLRAQSLVSRAGRVELTAPDGVIRMGTASGVTPGLIDVSGGALAGGTAILRGNSVDLFGDPGNPINSSRIIATGANNGGTITIDSATDLFLGESTALDASGTGTGSGGTINVAVTGGSAFIAGDMLAQAGKSGGNGGRISVSARDQLDQPGLVRASADGGNGGQISLTTSTGDITVANLDAHGAVTGGEITVSAAGDALLRGSANAHGLLGNGGGISLVAGSTLQVSGTLDAGGGTNGGTVYVSGASTDPSTEAVDIQGTIDARGGSGNGGSVRLYGDGAVRFEGDLYASGGTNGGEIRLHGTDSNYGGVTAEGLLDAHGTNGNGGLIDLYAIGNVTIYGDLLGWGGVDGGNISIIGAAVYFDSALAYGSTGGGGSVNVTADDISITDASAVIDVQGETGGGSIDLEARNSFVLGEDGSLSADTGSSGNGGSIHLYAGNSLVVYGDLSARGVDGGGSIYTGSGGGIDLNGANVDAGTVTGNAGTWTIAAPQMTVLNGSTQGTVGTGPVIATTTDIQDGDLNNAFATGTNIVLEATSGDVQFDDAQILAASSSPLFLHVNATGAISGSGFSISSTGGELEMLFNADSAGGNDNGGYIDFNNASLASSGGLIAMFGQSDQTSGFATGYANGISLADVDLDSTGGGVVLHGHSTGSGSGTGYAGVYLGIANIMSGGGNVDIHGTGMGSSGGVLANNGSITSNGGQLEVTGTASGADAVGVSLDGMAVNGGAGNVTVNGSAAQGSGVLFANGAGVTTTSGAISLIGEGANFGLDVGDGALDTDSGDITLQGTALAATATAGVRMLSGGLNTNGGNITVTGNSAGGVGVQLGDGSAFAIGSGGGAIAINGIGVDGGVQLTGATMDSGDGRIDIEGTASGADAVGVSLDGMAVNGGAGDVTVNGSAAQGSGVLFANGAGVTTTSGAISLIGEGANFGLDVGDGALDTDSGDILLQGTALAATATAGVRMLSGGLNTNGGDITVTGDSAGGVGVQLGDGSAFAIGSGGGAISIKGTGETGGVQLIGATMDSGDGRIDIEGRALATNGTGVYLNEMAVTGGAGDVTVAGAAAQGSGVLFANGAGISTTSGAISLIGQGQAYGLDLGPGVLETDSGAIRLEGTATGTDAVGAHLDGMKVSAGTGDVTVDGLSALGVGVLFANGAGVSTTSGAISLIGEGANFGLDLGDGVVDTDTGDITLDGTALASTATAGVRMLSGSLNTNGGDIKVIGDSAGGVGVQLGDGSAFAIGSGGGAISIKGTGETGGVQLTGATMDSGDGRIDIEGRALAADGIGVSLNGMAVTGGAGDVKVTGAAELGSGVLFANGAGITTTSGGISLIGIGHDVGLSLDGGEFTTDSGHIDLRGRGLGANSDGLMIGSGINIATNGGGIELSGEGGSGAGISLGSGSFVDAGDSLVVVRARNDGSSDAIRLQGAIHSGLGVNLRLGGVDYQGGLHDHADENILIGGGTNGFVLSDAELAMIDSPELIIGSSLHEGSIQVLGAITRDGNLTLQNDGGSGGIDIQATLDVGNGTLALSSGGSITQTNAGAITAHSLLATAAGDVLLGSAQNNVAATTLAGSAGGAFEFQDVDTLAIGSVSAVGFDAASGGLSSLGATGIDADGNVLVQNLAGDLILYDDIQGNNIDLVTAGRLQNLGGAELLATGNWRVWANTWEGETRGGLAGSGELPNLYGCTYLGACGVTVSATEDHFIYVQQPTALINIDDFSREYGLENPVFTFTVTGAILGDTASNVATGMASTTATIASDVGLYPITGTFTSAAGYRIQVLPGTLSVTPAMLFFTADGAVRYLGSPNPNFTGTVTGFRNGDTVESVFGAGDIWSSPAGFFSPVGFYPINGGSTAKNYVFSQAPGNATALQIIPLPQLTSTPIDLIRETVNTYVYDRNFGGAPVCALNASIDDQRLASSGDELSNEWSKVRSRPNLTNCFDTERQDGCGSF